MFTASHLVAPFKIFGTTAWADRLGCIALTIIGSNVVGGESWESGLLLKLQVVVCGQDSRRVRLMLKMRGMCTCKTRVQIVYIN